MPNIKEYSDDFLRRFSISCITLDPVTHEVTDSYNGNMLEYTDKMKAEKENQINIQNFLERRS